MEMTQAAAAAREEPKEEKEADHHPYFRPKDAATLILIDRSAAKPKVLVGRRHDNVVFMPGKYVFPGASTRRTTACPSPLRLPASSRQTC
jgi:hypothetical protein